MVFRVITLKTFGKSIIFVVISLKTIHMISRDSYIEQIEPFINKPFVKVMTGIRRSGKSVILRLLKDELLRRGVLEDHIIYMNFESFEWIDIQDSKILYSYIRFRIEDKDTYYILLDEIQVVAEWEKAVNSFLVDFNSDVYVRVPIQICCLRSLQLILPAVM